jgi:hypothetical protein
MKVFLRIIYFQVLLLLISGTQTFAAPRPGFYIPDNLELVSFRYRVVNNLIILPVTINDSIKVNLILDTGCRSLVLFGKRFQKLFRIAQGQAIKFSGLGSGDPVYGKLSLDNTVSIDAVIGNNIPIVVVPSQNLFQYYPNVHGVIGYDIFTKFEVEIDSKRQIITFRPAATATLGSDFTNVPIRVEDARPLIDCRVIFTKDKTHICDLMIDTGSALGLLLKTTDIKKYDVHGYRKVLGRGFNGSIEGIETVTEKLMVDQVEMNSVLTGIISSPWHNYASIGMDILKDYTLVLNYCKGYAGFRKA